MERRSQIAGVADARAHIYAALDHVWVQRGMPARHHAAVHKAIEHLRAEAMHREDVALAEAIAVALHRIEQARRSENEDAEADARTALTSLGQAWMKRRTAGREGGFSDA